MPVEPQKPDPIAFGLTQERVAEFDRADGWFTTRLMWVVFVVTFLVLASRFFDKGGPRIASLGDLLILIPVGVIGLGLSFAAAFVVAFPGGTILNVLWKRTQWDYGRLQVYERAVAQYQAAHAEWLTTERTWWDSLHPSSFEQQIATFFKKQGHTVVWTGRSGDGGVDIRLTTLEGKKVIVQCKAHEKPISPGAVRELYGTLLHEKVDEAWLMSRSGFTTGATEFASGKAIRLLNLDHILVGR